MSLTSWLGAKAIAQREALVRAAYLDDTTPPFTEYSIGFGSQDPPVKPGDVIEEAEAFRRLIAHIRRNDAIIAKLIQVPVSQQIWDAVSSLYYQGGSAPVKAVAAKLNAGQTKLAILEFANWPFGQNRIPTEGHAKRRMDEMAIANAGYYGDLSTYKFYAGDPRKTLAKMRPFPDAEPT